MKVLQLITSLGYGGAERLIVDLAPRLRLRGVEVAVVSLNGSMPLVRELEGHGIPVYTLSHSGTIYSLPGLARSWWRLRKLVEKLQPQIVHSHLYLSDILSRLAVPGSCRLISTLHNRDGWWYQPTRVRSLGKTWLDNVTGRLRHVRFISVSDDVSSAAEGLLKVPPARNRVVANGICLDRVKTKDAGLSPGRKIIQVARFYPQKNHHMALRAFRIVLGREPEARLVFVGDGPLREAIERDASDMGVGHAVEFLGARDDVADQLVAADVFWLTSSYEGLPVACIEAMASGLPTVVTSVGGLPELVKDRGTGCLVDPDDHEQLAMLTLELFSDPQFAASLGRNAREHVIRRYSIELTAERYVKVYRQLLEGDW